MTRYESAKEIYASYGIDTENAINTLQNVTVSIHCWQGDDVIGFDNKAALSGGIQTTGNYPGRARTPEATRYLTASPQAETKSNPNISRNGLNSRKQEIWALTLIPLSSRILWSEIILLSRLPMTKSAITG